MKIAFFSDSFLPQIDGIIISTVKLIEGLAEKGHTIYLYIPKYKGAKIAMPHNVVVRQLRAVPALFYPEFKLTLPSNPMLLANVRKADVDVIHFNNIITVGLNGIMAAKVLRKPLVGTFHTLIGEEQYLKHLHLNSPSGKRAAWRYINMYFNRCDLVTCPAESTKQELLNHKCKRPINVISNGIKLSEIDYSRAKLTRNLYAPSGKLLVFVGRIAYEKNLTFLLEAVRIVVDDDPSLRLLLVGYGPQMDEVRQKVADLRLANNVVLTGPIDHDELMHSGIYAAADLFVSASKTENQPMTILEAQAHGTVCIGMRAKGMPDLIKHEVNGLLVDHDNVDEFAAAIKRALSDQELYQQMKLGVREEIKRHDLPYVISEWVKAYQELVEQKKIRKRKRSGS